MVDVGPACRAATCHSKTMSLTGAWRPRPAGWTYWDQAYASGRHHRSRAHAHRPGPSGEGHVSRRARRRPVRRPHDGAARKGARCRRRAIEDIHWGCVKQQDEQGYDVARMAALIAGLAHRGAAAPRSTATAAPACRRSTRPPRASPPSCEDVQIAGGVEHMHHIPMEAGFDPSPRYLYRHSPATMNMGLTAENLALRYKHQPQGAGRVRPAQPSAGRGGDRLRRVQPRDHPDLGPRRGGPQAN